MSFLPIAIVGYALNGLAMLIDKILIKNSLPNPFVYAFYINIVGYLLLGLLPFVHITYSLHALIFGSLSGIFFVVALVSMFQSLKHTELTVATPVVGSLHPLFALLLGSVLLGQTLSNSQLLAFFVLLLGAAILTYNLWSGNLSLGKSLIFMGLAGLFFAFSSIFVKEAYKTSDLISGLLFSKVSAAIFVSFFMLIPRLREGIFTSKVAHGGFVNQTSTLLLFGQSMGAAAGILLNVAVSYQQPALVNSLFGVQYMVILVAALALYKKWPHLLSEHLTRNTIMQKILGAVVLCIGVYLLSR